MRSTYPLLLVLLVCATACTAPSPKPNQMDVGAAAEQAAIETLVRQMYKWHDADHSKNELQPLDGSDTLYMGMDLDKLELRLGELRRTHFFTDEFIGNYDTLVRTIDRFLKNGKMQWHVGELPPFGDDADPWTDSQDYPDADNFSWDTVPLTFESIDSVKATLTWTWGNPQAEKGFSYRIRVVKVDGRWKVAYLQGFDRGTFIGR